MFGKNSTNFVAKEFKDLHIENSKNYKRFSIFAVFDVQVFKCCR